MNTSRYDMIRDRLSAALAPTSLQLVDDSHLHAGHAGAEDGRGHYRVAIVSTQFAGLRAIARHQLVYRALGDLLQTDIHALSITALTPDEAAH
jgi:BolA family transcriptional regulator, general stress-responsive regulator